MEVIYDADIRPLTTFGVAARAACVAYYDSLEELHALLHDVNLPRPFKHIGQGSNLLFADDFPGTLLISRIAEYELERWGDDVTIAVSAGVVMDDLCRAMADAGVWGLENLSGIPGTVGASAVQNVGAYGIEAGDRIVSVDAIDIHTAEPRTFTHDEMQFGYRHSIFKTPAMRDRYVITCVRFRLTTEPSPVTGYANLHAIVGDDPSATDMRRAVIAMRDSKLPNPAVTGSAGSFFKNPVITPEHFQQIEAMYPGVAVPHFIVDGGMVKVPAAWLIDKAGCKSMTAGGASLWPRQPLVIVNTDGDATARDIITLMERVIAAVSSRFNITLHPEAEIIHNA